MQMILFKDIVQSILFALFVSVVLVYFPTSLVVNVVFVAWLGFNWYVVNIVLLCIVILIDLWLTWMFISEVIAKREDIHKKNTVIAYYTGRTQEYPIDPNDLNALRTATNARYKRMVSIDKHLDVV